MGTVRLGRSSALLRFNRIKLRTFVHENRVTIIIGRRNITDSKLTEAIRSQWSDQDERRESK